MRNGHSPLSKTYLYKPSVQYQQVYRQQLSQKQLKPVADNKEQVVSVYRNGVLLGNAATRKGLFLADEGLVYMEVEPLPNHARSHLFVFPDATYCLAQTSENNSQLHERCVFFNQSSFLQCYSIRHGKLQGVQYSYVPSLRQFTKSHYKNDKLYRIVHSEFLGENVNPMSLIEDREIAKVVGCLLTMDFKPLSKTVKSIKIGEGMRYYGEVDGQSPVGYGCILSPSETFVGEFWNGLLHGLGRIRFANGDVCEGSFHQGICSEFGRYATSESTIYKARNTPIEQHEFEDFLLHERGNREKYPAFTFPLFDRLKTLYNNLMTSYADDARSKYLSKQGSKLSVENSQPSPPQSDHTKSLHSVSQQVSHQSHKYALKKKGQSQSQPYIVVHRTSSDESLIPLSKHTQKSSKKPEILIQPETEHDEGTIAVEQLADGSVSQEFARNNPRHFVAKQPYNQMKTELVFNKNRGDRLTGPQLMTVIHQQSHETGDDQSKMKRAVSRITRNPSPTPPPSDLYNIRFKP